MCIRDSARTGPIFLCDTETGAPHTDGGGGRLDLQRRRAQAQLAREGLDGPCLLYTSDAADERSSVDLGGRRIIKKKKTTGNADTPSY